MAEDEDQQDDELSTSEAQELEKLLEETEGEEGEKKKEKKEGPFLKKLLHRLKTDKKFLMFVGGGALLLIIGSGAGLYLFLSKEAAPPVAEEELAEPEEEPEKEVEQANVYTLEPFFLPLKINDRETGQFITVTPNLLLSNSALDEEVDKILPQIRKNIYRILRRKSPQDWFQDRVQIEERIKKEIITVANTDLLSGTGTIEDVFYTQFVIK